MSLRILVAPSGFKESLAAEEVADLIEIGVKRVIPSAIVHKVPLVDGGEGFTKTLVHATGGTLHFVDVTGPVGKMIPSHFGFLGGSETRTAVLEMSAAAGLRLVPAGERNPLITTTYGVGELIKAALDAGAERILIGCGDSGTNDGGAGMAQALGVKLLDKNGTQLGFGGQYLKRLAKIDMSNRDPRLDNIQIDVACNWHNILCGENGVARVFGPQKGASPETVQMLADALDNFANIIEKDLSIDVRLINGGGASGGLGAGLFALAGAKLHQRYEIVMQYLELDELLKDSDLVLTAEGGIDFQTPRGKIPSEVASRAKKFGLPVIALAGTVGKGAKINYDHGIDSFLSILDKPCSLSEAVENAPSLLKHAAERAMRFVMIGQQMRFVNV